MAFLNSPSSTKEIIMNILRIAAALVVLAGFIGSGCASNRSRPQVTVLRDPLAPLKQQFNGNASKPRVIALCSPTCGGCLYGAKALQHEARTNSLTRNAEFLVVWMPMLDTDTEGEATKAAAH